MVFYLIQVINALFGLNAAVHKANIVSPAIYSDIGTIPPLSRSNSPVGGPSSLPHSSSLYTLCVSEPLSSLVNDILMVMPRQVANDFRRNVDIKAYGHEETDGKPKQLVFSRHLSTTTMDCTMKYTCDTKFPQ